MHKSSIYDRCFEKRGGLTNELFITMKKFFSSLMCTALVAGAFASSSFSVGAAENNADSPTLYIRGEMNDWGVKNEYAFSCENNTYTIHLESLKGQFKISDADWNIEYGAFPDEPSEISGPTVINGVKKGGNYRANSLNDVVISFTYQPENPTYAVFTISVNGVEPERPVEPVEPVIGSGTLPLLYINVYDADGKLNNEIISKDLDHKNYFSGEYWLDTNGCEWLEALGAESIGSKDEPLPLEIKARGNWTRRGFSKKPFKLKLGKKQSLLGLTKSKHFAILAHADDFYGYMRNFTGFNLGKRIGLPWTPWQQPVEVIINGDYRGLYFLTESIRVDSDRVNIQELEDNATDPSVISGGYLIELDNYDEENQIRMEEKGQAPGFKDVLRITFDTPEEYSDLQRQFVTEQFTAMNDAVGANSDNLWSYMDLDDAARYYIVEEIISHTEAYHGSTYMFRDRGENQKWHFSPLWDCGNAFNGPVDNYFTNTVTWGNTWIASMRMNQKFMDKVRETWKWFMSQKYAGIEDDLTEYCNHLKEAALADYKRWNNQPVPADGQSVVDNRDMHQRLADVKYKLQAKTSWLSQQFGQYDDALYTEPERDTTEAAPLPEYITTDISEIKSALADGEGIDIYTLQGMRVEKPVAGSLYIVRKNGKTIKVLGK